MAATVYERDNCCGDPAYNRSVLTANQSIILKCHMSPGPNPWGVETYEINKTKEIALRFVY